MQDQPAPAKMEPRWKGGGFNRCPGRSGERQASGKKAVAQDKGKQADKTKDVVKLRRSRPLKVDKAALDKARLQPRDVTRSVKEEINY